MLLYGKNVIYEAIEAKHNIKEIFLKDNIEDQIIDEYIASNRCKLTRLSKKEMDNKFPNLNQGYGALASDIRLYKLEEVIKDNKQVFLILDKIQDPHNFGAILRSVDAFGVDGVIYAKDHACGITDTVIKVSTGAIFHTKMIPVVNINQTIATLKKKGFWIVGMDGAGKDTLDKVNIDTSLGVIIGSEGYGISQLVLKNCDYVCRIPMYGKVNSLNASVSAGVTLALLRSLENK